jgi:hypothetical protein
MRSAVYYLQFIRGLERSMIWGNIRVIAFSICLAATICGGVHAASRFDQIDKYVACTPADVESSLDRLAGYLASSSDDDLGKTRAIFRWITGNIVFDPETYYSSVYGDQSPEKVLKTRKAVCGGYSNLFDALAKRCGIKSVTIDGYSRGKGYQIGSSTNKNDHSWNAVALDGEWRLIDCVWGAGYVDNNDKFVRKQRDYYFLTKPEHFIYDHFPRTASWQLLENPITRNEFERLVYIRPAFIANNLRLMSHKQGIIETDNVCTVELESPENVLMSAKINRNDVEVQDTSVFVQRDGNLVSVSAVFPNEGDYTLRLFTKRADEPGNYEWAADYRVSVTSRTNLVSSFPTVFETFHQKNAHLYEPMRGLLKSGSTERFKISAPGAIAVAVIVDGKWVNLQQSGEMFEGDALITGGEVQIAARFPGSSNYQVLLKYTAS